jgi:hypothetical protein
MRLVVILLQIVSAIVLTPLAIKFGLLNAINMATRSNFNLQYQLSFAVGHFGTYVNALVLGLLFWLVGRIAAPLLGASRVPSWLTLLATLVLALGLAHLSQLPIIGALHNEVYARTFTSVPPIVYPLIGAVVAALLVPGKRR